MRPKILKLSTVILLFVLIGAGCVKEPIDGVPTPGLCIYKTKGEYFNYINTWTNEKGRTVGNPAYRIQNDSRIQVVNGDTVYVMRVKLTNGYILQPGGEIGSTNYFTDMTYIEMVRYNSNLGKEMIGTDSLDSRVIDKDPFTEFYFDTSRPRKFEMEDTAEINMIIRNGNIEDYFKKYK